MHDSGGGLSTYHMVSKTGHIETRKISKHST